ncbi:benenodin family lasso peptide [Sphingomonas sp. LaA6.9]|nr:benenodin family lasso peptide [Sphingomonas sp. LaA6.9]MCJ8157043.1 benenodin family lasso peptide [Sphingomonas sp. LaA6.9]
MEHLNERSESLEIELGTASVETRGNGVGKRDIPDEQYPLSGLTDD